MDGACCKPATNFVNGEVPSAPLVWPAACPKSTVIVVARETSCGEQLENIAISGQWCLVQTGDCFDRGSAETADQNKCLVSCLIIRQSSPTAAHALTSEGSGFLPRNHAKPYSFPNGAFLLHIFESLLPPRSPQLTHHTLTFAYLDARTWLHWLRTAAIREHTLIPLHNRAAKLRCQSRGVERVVITHLRFMRLVHCNTLKAPT